MFFAGVFGDDIKELTYIRASRSVISSEESVAVGFKVGIRIQKQSAYKIRPELSEFRIGGHGIIALFVNASDIMLVKNLHISLQGAEIREDADKIAVISAVIPYIQTVTDFRPAL